MEEKINSLLNSKYAVILAFIPIFNIVYLIFRVLFVRVKIDRIPIWYFAAVAVPAVVLYNILPGLWGWCVTHLVISCISAFLMHKSRGCYKGKLGFRPNVFFFAVIVFIFAVSVNVMHDVWPAYSMGLWQEKLYEATAALTSDDAETWYGLVHPEHGDELSDIEAVRRRFAVKVAGLEGGFEHRTNRGARYFSREVEDGKAAGVEVFVCSEGSGQLYRISGTWQECEHGSGFIDFEINLG